MSLAFLFEKRLRGFRVVEIAAFFCLIVLVLGVYFSKAHAGHETAEIGDVDQQIVETQRHVRLLSAEVAHLEAPARIELLSQQYLGLSAISAKHETPDTGLMEIARQASEPVSPLKAVAPAKVAAAGGPAGVAKAAVGAVAVARVAPPAPAAPAAAANATGAPL